MSESRRSAGSVPSGGSEASPSSWGSRQPLVFPGCRHISAVSACALSPLSLESHSSLDLGSSLI